MEKAETTTVVCPRCDAAFVCSPEGACWCSELPPMPLTGERCFCPNCLRQRIAELQAAKA